MTAFHEVWLNLLIPMSGAEFPHLGQGHSWTQELGVGAPRGGPTLYPRGLEVSKHLAGTPIKFYFCN